MPGPYRGPIPVKHREFVENLLRKELIEPGTIAHLLRDFEFTARPKQRIPEDDPRILLIQAGRGWGKTWTGAHWCKRRIEDGCKQLLAVGPTATDVHDVMVPMLMEVLEGATYRKTLDSPCVMYRGGTIHLRSGQRVDRCRGLNVGGVWADEIDSWKPELYKPKDAWLAVIEPACRLDPARFLITSTPKRGGLISWLVTRVDVRTVRGHTRENAENLSKGVVEAITSAFQGSSWLERQELGGEIVDEIEGAIVKRAMIDEHRLLVPPPLRRVIIGVDPSGGADEQGIVAMGVDDRKHYYVLGDPSCKLTPDGWGRRVMAAYEQHDADLIVAEKNFGGDMVKATIQTISPSAPVKIVTAARAKHVRFEPVGALYEQGRMHHCGSAEEYEKLENEITAFTHRKYEGVGSPNRCLVAGTQIATATGWRPIEQIQVGEQVWTRRGLRQVLASRMTDPAALVIRRQFSNGQSLTGTPDHLVWTENRGFTAMDALNWDDILCTWKTSAGFKTSSTFATPKVAPRLRNATTRLVEAARSVRGCFIEKSGRRRMAVSREAETSTTWTATGSTTSWEICAASLMQNTLNSMRAQLQPKPAGIWHAFVCWLRSGTEVALDWLGIPSMVERLGKIESLCFEFAPAAASSTALSTFARSRDSVLASASCGITSRRRDSTKHAAAQFASLRSQSRNQSSSEHAPVRAGKSFDVVERMPVYDLTVAGAHEYFANGVLVHNCDALVWAAAELMGRRGPSPRDLYGPEGLVARS